MKIVNGCVLCVAWFDHLEPKSQKKANRNSLAERQKHRNCKVGKADHFLVMSAFISRVRMEGRKFRCSSPMEDDGKRLRNSKANLLQRRAIVLWLVKN